MDILNDELMHYGTPRKSGRYPYGSGEEPYQHPYKSRGEQRSVAEIDPAVDYGYFLDTLNGYKKQGLEGAKLAEAMGMSTTELRAANSIAKASKKAEEIRQATKLKDHGYSNTAIAEKMGLSGESYVRTLLNPVLQERNDLNMNTADVLRKSVDEKKFIDIGAGVDREMGVSGERLKTAVQILKNEGYQVRYVKVEQATMPGQFTTVKVLCHPGTTNEEMSAIYKDKTLIKSVGNYSVDNGKTFYGIESPKSIDSSRIKIRYGDEEGVSGKDLDGVIQLRRGVEDISLGNSSYAQVRIAVDGTHYLKGMAMYCDDMPDGYDIIYNTNKKTGTPAEKVFKPLKDDPDNPFGAVIKDGGQRHYIDENGKDQLSVVNKVKEEGDWSEYSKSLSAQFLSKQSMQLINKQLNLSYADKAAEFDEIKNLDNPAVKKKLLESFADDCDSSSEHLKVAALPKQATKVILPVATLKDNEIYAPTYENGTEVALIRYPHAGTFEIPILKVNNKQKDAKAQLGNAVDAVGINSQVADRLSGADFDGDTVMVIPTNTSTGVKITSTPRLKGLKDFDSKDYKFTDEQFEAKGMDILSKKISSKDSNATKALKQKIADGYSPTQKDYMSVGEEALVIPSQRKQMEMGKVSNLITDMTLQGATDDELCRAVKHSMVVIDAEKHKLDYKQSEIDNNIAQLKAIYQTKENGRHGGASTLISKAKSQAVINEREEGQTVVDENGKKHRLYIDPDTGEKLYTYTGRTYTNKAGKEVVAQQKSTKMAETKDAHTLSSGTPQEEAYANYANKLKALANTARKEYLATENTEYNPSAAKEYKEEVDSLKAKLDIALRNAPRERQAQLLADKIVSEKLAENPYMEKGDKKKAKQQAISQARATYGASGKDSRIKIEENEWHAIQSGAISNNMLTQILDHTDMDIVRQFATPRTTTSLSSAKVSRIKALSNSGYSIDEIAKDLGVSSSTVSKYLNPKNN